MLHVTVQVRTLVPVRLSRDILDGMLHWIRVSGEAKLALTVKVGLLRLGAAEEMKFATVKFRARSVEVADSEELGTRTYVSQGLLNGTPAKLVAQYPLEGPASQEPDSVWIEELHP